MERLRKQHPKMVAFAVFNTEELGVPQTRRRLLAGSPDMIAKLLRIRAAANIRSVLDVIPCPYGSLIRNSKYAKSLKKKTKVEPGSASYTYVKASWTDNCTYVGLPSPTICASRIHYWIRVSGSSVTRKPLSVADYAAIQTFPSYYEFPECKSLALLQIGNAVPPLVAYLLMSTEDVCLPVRGIGNPLTPSRLWRSASAPGPSSSPSAPDSL